jgi:alpha-ketoglutaric semialdehyde dehydrogenase
MPLHGKNVIGFGSVGEGSYTFKAVNPATQEALETTFHEASDAEVERAMTLMAEAFPVFRQIDPEKRAEFLDRAADEILNLGDELIERGSAETALPEARLVGERGRTMGQLKMFAELIREGSWVDARIDQADPNREPLAKPDTRLMLMPIGPVVVKAHRSHPGTAELVGLAVQKAAKETGMPEGVYAVLQGRGRQVGDALVKHPATVAVGFTGSLAGGRALFNTAAARPEPIPVYAEMGSLNPVFVLPGALEERGDAIAEGLLQSVTLGVGQFCTNPGLVLGVESESLTQFLNKTSELSAGAAPETMLNAGICEAYNAGVQTLSSTEGVNLGGKSGVDPNPNQTQAAAYVFTTDVETFAKHPELSEEVFGPATLVVTCGAKANLEEVARNLAFDRQ